MSLERIALALALLSACGAQISDGASNSAVGSVDGGDDTSGSGSGSDPGPGPVGTTPACAARVVYLNFEGQALARALVSDATKNQASWMQNATGTAPPYHNGDTNRTTDIQTIIDGVRSELSQFPITVVTDRPATGSYVMVVLGGKQSNVSSAYGASVNALDCGDLVPNDVAWVADSVAPDQHVINIVVGAVGFGIGLTATADPDDCMCGWANNCQSDNTTACKLGTAITRDQTATQLCSAAGASQNEVTTLHDSFCGK
ncbi:MAG TPA: hypothetical protein VH165_31670 [Kofleriaceae bacterium]|jgi:hypothetical protein|nr:hypothetical protein [Kofleriaceae bacterium]